MAIRNIRIIGDEILEKKCRPVTEMKPRIKELIEDMLDTMYDAQGVGLAPPQAQKRAFVPYRYFYKAIIAYFYRNWNKK